MFCYTELLSNKPCIQSCTEQLVALHLHFHHTDKQSRHLSLRKALLSSLKTALSSGRTVLCVLLHVHMHIHVITINFSSQICVLVHSIKPVV